MDVIDSFLRLSRILLSICVMTFTRLAFVGTFFLPKVQNRLGKVPFVASWSNFIQAIMRISRREWYNMAQEGNPAPNPQLLTSDGSTSVNMLDLARKGRPLVVNFGSCSWPPFMNKLAAFNKVSSDNYDYHTLNTPRGRSGILHTSVPLCAMVH